MTSEGQHVEVVGAGVLGLWQALTLALAGFEVTLVEQSASPFERAQSRFAGAMLSPYCEEEGAGALVRELGLRAIELWAPVRPALVNEGTLVVAQARDQSELTRFAAMTSGYTAVNAEGLTALEPELAGRFFAGLFYPDEAHLVTPDALGLLLEAVRAAGCDVQFGRAWVPGAVRDAAAVIDCRGIGARADLRELRGVRGERLLLQTDEVHLRRPVRLLHPRHPLYVVPWGNGRYMVGSTVLESEDTSAMTVRSALELLGLAYALHPAFGEAEIVDMAAGLRPALPDNVPRAIARGRMLRVNGAHRHGFLLAPILAEAVSGYLEHGDRTHPLLRFPPEKSP